MGALGRVEEGRREVELGIEADSEGCWFMAAREEESPALLLVVIGGRVAGSWSEDVVGREVQQPCVAEG